jgi:hypothetical protein
MDLKFWKVLYIVTLYCKYTRALIYEVFVFTVEAEAEAAVVAQRREVLQHTARKLRLNPKPQTLDPKTQNPTS